MANWAYVENDVVVELHDTLPRNWRNISNFFVLETELEALKNLSWYPVEITTGPFNSQTQRYGETTYTFDSERSVVVQNTEIFDIEVDQVAVFNQQRSAFINHLRSARDKLLSASDWTMMLDIVESKPAEWKDAWSSYRQQLRDLPQLYINEYPEMVDINQIVFPEKPMV